TFGDDASQRVRSDEVSGFAQLLRNGPKDGCAYRVGVLVQVLTVQTKPSFQPKTVARSKADPHDAVVRKKLLGKIPRFLWRQRDFESIFAGVAGARREPVFAWFRGGHEGEVGKVQACADQHAFCLRALQGEKDAIQSLDRHIEVTCDGAEMSLILCGIPGIG